MLRLFRRIKLSIEPSLVHNKIKVKDEKILTEWQYRIEELAMAVYEAYRGLVKRSSK